MASASSQHACPFDGQEIGMARPGAHQTDEPGFHASSVIMPAATVPLVASSTKTNAPVARSSA